MNNEQKLKLAEMLLARAEIAGKTLSKPAVAMMIEDLADLPFERVYATLQAWGRTSSEFPHPAKIREKLMPAENDLDDGRDIASKVIGAVAKFGSYQAQNAKDYIGEIGWECVKRMGGWATLCSEVTEENKGITFAQIRDLSMTLKKKSINGTLATPQDFPNMLPDGKARPVLDLIQGALEKK
jgi:hypothetical protein